jgi:hypothetical protein
MSHLLASIDFQTIVMTISTWAWLLLTPVGNFILFVFWGPYPISWLTGWNVQIVFVAWVMVAPRLAVLMWPFYARYMDWRRAIWSRHRAEPPHSPAPRNVEPTVLVCLEHCIYLDEEEVRQMMEGESDHRTSSSGDAVSKGWRDWFEVLVLALGQATMVLWVLGLLTPNGLLAVVVLVALFVAWPVLPALFALSLLAEMLTGG